MLKKSLSATANLLANVKADIETHINCQRPHLRVGIAGVIGLDELESALKQIDLSEVPLYAKSDEEETEGFHCWWLTANPKIWSFSDMPVGEVATRLANATEPLL